MPKLDLTYYSGQDNYTDGESEKRILTYLRDNENHDYTEVFLKDSDLPVFQNLSDARNAILSWYDFNPDSTVLEVGAGMGILTEMLCERCRSVTSVEFSLQRAKAIDERCKGKDNLRIIVGDLSAIQFEEKFDYITVIGVLEHQSVYNSSPNAPTEFMTSLRRLLKPQGKILLAIENKYGLKYWCGEIDDHSGIPFGTINDFQFGGKARTFDKKQLEKILHDAGLNHTKFFYPLPDYKFPRVIYSEQYLPKATVHASMHPIYYSNYYSYQPIIAEEQKLYAPIIQNGVFEFFANSFLVECTMEKDTQLSDIDFAVVTTERNSQFRTCTRLKGNKFEKFALEEVGEKHIKQAYNNLNTLSERGFNVITQTMENGIIRMPYVSEQTMEDVFLNNIREKKIEQAIKLLDSFRLVILQSSDIVPACQNAILTMDLIAKPDNLDYGPILHEAYADMLLSNCFYIDEKIVFFDQEWQFFNLPANFVFYLALSVLFNSYPWIEAQLPKQEIIDRYSMNTLWCVYEQVEQKLFSNIQNEGTCHVLGKLRSYSRERIKQNIELLQNGLLEIKGLEEKKNECLSIIEEDKKQIAGREMIIAEKDQQIAGRETIIEEKNQQIAGREYIIQTRDVELSECKFSLAQQRQENKRLQEVVDEIKNKNIAIERQLKLYQGDTLMKKIGAAWRCLRYKSKD